MKNLTRRTRRNLFAAFLLTLMIFVLLPFVWLIVSSFKTNHEIFVGVPYALPQQWNFDNYATAWVRGGFGRLFWNSAAIAVIVVFLTLLLSAPAGYAFAKMRFKGNDLLFYLCLFGMTIPIQAMIVPLYQLLQHLGLVNTLIGVALVQVGNGIPFGLFIMRNFFRSLPDELVDSARIDGCGNFQIFGRVLLPLAVPAVSALAIISALGTWNDFFLPLVVLISPSVQTVPLGLVRFVDQFSADQRLIFSGTVISFIPIVILYVIAQKHFVQGLTQGALKD